MTEIRAGEPRGAALRPKVVIVGAGAAGLMAAAQAAACGAAVTVLERNRQAGRKLLLSGKGRCNVTHQGPVRALVDGMPGNGRFLYGALSRFGAQELRAHLESLGVPTEVERGNRVFPRSGDAASVRDALLREAIARGCRFLYGERVVDLVIEEAAAQGRAVAGVTLGDGRTLAADAVIVATGGRSYPGTGSTGDGYQLARQAGHEVVPTFPSLVPLVCEQDWARELTGLSLRNVRLQATAGDGSGGTPGKLADEFGEMLFTHFGVSGPIVLRASRAVSAYFAGGGQLVHLSINLKPALEHEVLDRRVQRDLQKYANRELRNSLDDLAPAALAQVLVSQSGIDPATRSREITRAQRLTLVGLLAGLPLTTTATRGYREAIVTAGGVDLRQVSPKTMESRLVAGLYFAGEVLDIDGYTGGFNLQAAFATGWVAGRAAGAGNDAGS